MLPWLISLSVTLYGLKKSATTTEMEAEDEEGGQSDSPLLSIDGLVNGLWEFDEV